MPAETHEQRLDRLRCEAETLASVPNGLTPEEREKLKFAQRVTVAEYFKARNDAVD